jgi:hypothetical protein
MISLKNYLAFSEDILASYPENNWPDGTTIQDKLCI